MVTKASRPFSTALLCALGLTLLALSPASAEEAAPRATSTPSLEELFTPTPQPVSACFGCGSVVYTTSPGGGAPSHWGKGTSCANAQSDLTTQTRTAANAICALESDGLGACRSTVVVTTSCWWSPAYGLYVVDGYANFGCRYETGVC